MNLENELVKYIGGECKFAIDHWGIDQIWNAASQTTAANGGTAIEWDAAMTDGEPWIWKKFEIENYIEKVSNEIWKKTLRANGSYIICGIDVGRVLKQLQGSFTPASGVDKKPPTGPYVAGKLNGRTVIVDPFVPATEYVMGWKGSSVLEAGFVYAPYIPLYTTPTITLSNLQSQKGFCSSQGFKVINHGMFGRGSIDSLD